MAVRTHKRPDGRATLHVTVAIADELTLDEAHALGRALLGLRFPSALLWSS
jgi:hypothetical protein